MDSPILYALDAVFNPTYPVRDAVNVAFAPLHALAIGLNGAAITLATGAKLLTKPCPALPMAAPTLNSVVPEPACATPFQPAHRPALNLCTLPPVKSVLAIAPATLRAPSAIARLNLPKPCTIAPGVPLIAILIFKPLLNEAVCLTALPAFIVLVRPLTNPLQKLDVARNGGVIALPMALAFKPNLPQASPIL